MCVHPPLWVYDTNAPLWVRVLLNERPLINNGFLVQRTSSATHSFYWLAFIKLIECTSEELGGIVTLSRSYNIRSVLVQSFTRL